MIGWPQKHSLVVLNRLWILQTLFFAKTISKSGLCNRKINRAAACNFRIKFDVKIDFMELYIDNVQTNSANLFRHTLELIFIILGQKVCKLILELQVFDALKY